MASPSRPTALVASVGLPSHVPCDPRSCGSPLCGRIGGKHAIAIVEAAALVKAVSDRYEWHGTPQPTLDERRAHGPEQQFAVERLNKDVAEYEQWLEDRLRSGG